MRARATLTATLITLMLIAAVPAQAACLTASQASALVHFALPAAVDAVVRRCRGALPAEAYLNRSGGALVRRFRDASGGDVAAARAAVEVLTGNRLPAEVGDDSFAAMANDIIAAKLGQRLPVDQCRYVDATLEVLDPLPIENVERLTILLLRLGASKGGDVRFCAEPKR